MRSRIIALAASAMLALGCAQRTHPTAPVAPALDVRDDTVDTVLRALAQRSNTAVVVDPSAHFVASCARVRLVAPADTDAPRLADLVAASIGAVGLTMTSTRDGWVVSLRPGSPLPRECAIASLVPYRPPSSLAVNQPPYDAGPASPAEITAAVPTGDAGAATVLAQLAAQIHVTAPGHITIARGALDTMLANMPALTGSFRIVPRQQDGRVIGTTFFGIRLGSLMSLLGFQNGDTLLSLNGIDVSAPERALEAYTQLRTATSIRAEFLRMGRAQFIEYAVVP